MARILTITLNPALDLTVRRASWNWGRLTAARRC